MEKLKSGELYQRNEVNITNFAEKAPNLPFTEYDFYELYRETFKQSELGRMTLLRSWPGR